MHTYLTYLTYLKKSDEATNSKTPQKSLFVYLAESFVSSKKDPGGEFRRVLSESTCLMYMYLSPLVSVVRLRMYYVHTKEQGSGKSFGGCTVWYGYWYWYWYAFGDRLEME